MSKLKQLILGSPKSQSKSGKNSPHGSDLIPVTDIRDGVVITADNRYLKIIEILPTNFSLKSAVEQQNIIYYLASYLKVAPSSLQILIRTRRADVDAYCTQMERCYQQEINEDCKAMIWEDAQLVNYLAATEAVSRKFYIVLPYQGTSTDFAEISKELAVQAETAYQYLSYCGLEVVRHEDYDRFTFQVLYYSARLDAPPDNAAGYLTPVVDAETDGPEDGQLQLYELLTPTEIDTTNKRYVCMDGVYRSYFYLSGYPTQNPWAWLSPLVDAGDGVSVSFFLRRQPKEQVVQKISKTTMLNRSRMRDVGDTRGDYEELDDAINSGLYIKEQLNRENEELYYMNTLIEVCAGDEETLNARIRQVETLCRSHSWLLRPALYRQAECFRSMLPLDSLDTKIYTHSKRNILTQGAAKAFPFSSYELCDDTGVLLGINLYNSTAVILDNFSADLYSNGNMAIFGMSGAGKTYTLLLLAMRYRMLGVKVMIITPEKGFEYRSVCDAIGGQYYRISPGSADCINLMEIRRTTLDIDENLRGNELRQDSVLLDKVQQIHTYLSLRYPQMTPEESYQLNIAILACYTTFGITKDNASLLNPDGSFKRMPDFTDLLVFLQQYPVLKNLALMVQEQIEMGMGGQTNVDLHSDFIVLDTSGAPKKELSPCTYIATSFIRDEISRSRTRKKAVVGDELWKIAGDAENEAAADFVVELVKTVRGYGGIFISATQNVIDYFALRDGKFGDALLNNSRLKLLLQMEEAEALKVQEKLGLSDEETMQIIRSGRGQGLLCAGPNRVCVEIRASQTEHDLITTSRTDLEKRIRLADE